MLIKTLQVCGSTAAFNQEFNPFHKSKFLFHNSLHRNSLLFSFKDEQGFQYLRNHTRLLHDYEKRRRNIIVYSVEPGSSPSSGSPPNIIRWVVGVAIAIVIPFITQKWGPLLKSKIGAALQTVEDVVEAVEKVAEKVEEVAEDIADDLPTGGKLKEAIDTVEKFAERAADDAGAIDDFIDKVQEEEEKAESLVESIKDDKKPPEDSKEENPNKGN